MGIVRGGGWCDRCKEPARSCPCSRVRASLERHNRARAWCTCGNGGTGDCAGCREYRAGWRLEDGTKLEPCVSCGEPANEPPDDRCESCRDTRDQAIEWLDHLPCDLEGDCATCEEIPPEFVTAIAMLEQRVVDETRASLELGPLFTERAIEKKRAGDRLAQVTIMELWDWIAPQLGRAWRE